MRVEQASFHISVRPWNILDDDGELIVCVDDERLARQFAASDEMLAVCKKLVEIKREFTTNPVCTAPDIGALSKAIEIACAVIARVEGESCE